MDFGVGVFAPGWELCGVPGGEGLCRNFYLSGGTLAVCGIRPVMYLQRAVYEHNGTAVGR